MDEYEDELAAGRAVKGAPTTATVLMSMRERGGALSGIITEADAVRHDSVHGSVLLVGRATGASMCASIRGDRTEIEAAQ